MTLPPTPDELLPLKGFIKKSARPCIAFSMLPDAEVTLAGSKMGGATAALPEAFEWPQHEGKPLGFLLQINLADVTGGAEFGLPSEGLLSFFYDLYDCPSDPEIGGAFRVHYFPAEMALAATSTSGNDQQLTEARILFREGLSLPYFGSTALGDFEERVKEAAGSDSSEDEMNDFADAYGAYCADVSHYGDPNPEGGAHRMFGHPENIQDEMHACDNEWVMLLQLASDDTVDMMWGDSGMLYFWMTKADLAARRFDQVIMTLQCC